MVREVWYFIIGGRGLVYVLGLGELGRRVGYLFWFCFLIFGGDLVYSSIVLVLAPLCGDVHKGMVYTCGLFEAMFGRHGFNPHVELFQTWIEWIPYLSLFPDVV